MIISSVQTIHVILLLICCWSPSLRPQSAVLNVELKIFVFCIEEYDPNGLEEQAGVTVHAAWRRQDVKHVHMFCAERREGRREILEAAGTSDGKRLLTTIIGLKCGAKWRVDALKSCIIEPSTYHHLMKRYLVKHARCRWITRLLLETSCCKQVLSVPARRCSMSRWVNGWRWFEAFFQVYQKWIQRVW